MHLLHPDCVSAILLCCLQPAAQVLAESIWDRLQLHGFGSQAIVHTERQSLVRQQPKHLVWLHRDRPQRVAAGNPKLLLRATPLSTRRRHVRRRSGTRLWTRRHHALCVRRGTLRSTCWPHQESLGLYNETRDVPFTHPGIFLPQVVYFDRVRNLVLSTDGAMLYGERYSASAISPPPSAAAGRCSTRTSNGPTSTAIFPGTSKPTARPGLPAFGTRPKRAVQARTERNDAVDRIRPRHQGLPTPRRADTRTSTTGSLGPVQRRRNGP
jgi:hypothetical protein